MRQSHACQTPPDRPPGRAIHAPPQTTPRQTTPAPDRARDRGAALLRANVGAIRRIARRAAVRGGLAEDRCDDFVSHVFLALLRDDHVVLREYRGDAKLETYLVVVIQNLLRDYRNRHWGRYRPSAAARRLGLDAIRLEAYLVRDGLDAHTAIELMIRNHKSRSGRERLEALAARLADRRCDARRAAGEGACPAAQEEAFDPLEDRARSDQVRAIGKALAQAITDLPDDQRRLLRLIFRDNWTIARIARTLQRDQRSLYRLRDRCLRSLRHGLESKGLGWHRVRDAIEGRTSDKGLPSRNMLW